MASCFEISGIKTSRNLSPRKENFKANYFPKTSSQTTPFLSDFCGSMAGDQFSENDLLHYFETIQVSS